MFLLLNMFFQVTPTDIPIETSHSKSTIIISDNGSVQELEQLFDAALKREEAVFYIFH